MKRLYFYLICSILPGENFCTSAAGSTVQYNLDGPVFPRGPELSPNPMVSLDSTSRLGKKSVAKGF